MNGCDCNGPWCAVCGPKQQRVESVTVPVAAIKQLQAQLHDASLHANDFAEECHRQREENEKLKKQVRKICEAWLLSTNDDCCTCDACEAAKEILKDLEG